MTKRRRALMMQQAAPEPQELYPVGTDVKAMYAPYSGAWQGSRDISTSTGEIVSGSHYVNPNYIPIDPSYGYQKNGHRMENCAWYDADKVFISTFREYNVDVKRIPAAPANARYLRISCTSGSMASGLKLTRVE